MREVANSNVTHIKEKDGNLYWEAVKDSSALDAERVTKDKKPRVAPIKPGYEVLVHEMIKGKDRRWKSV